MVRVVGYGGVGGGYGGGRHVCGDCDLVDAVRAEVGDAPHYFGAYIGARCG